MSDPAMSEKGKTTEAEVLKRTEEYVRSKLSADPTGHDWFHIERVRNNALLVGRGERVDLFVVELAALLHDIADWKFHGGDIEAGPRTARAWLESQQVDEAVIDHVSDIIRTISFKGAGVVSEMKTTEGMVVQDGDRLDAIGAIGIARTFAYGGHKGRLMYDPAVAPELHATFEQYKASQGHTINHFYEKLLLLKDRLNTDTAKRIAAKRHEFMEQFLQQFLAEWNGKA
jgi:uncharacterized protein